MILSAESIMFRLPKACSLSNLCSDSTHSSRSDTGTTFFNQSDKLKISSNAPLASTIREAEM